jgi:uncharacterized protein
VVLEDDAMEAPKEILQGAPVVSSEMLSVAVSEGGLVVARGIMQCTPGKYRDIVDDDEFFTIICGRATLEVVQSTEECVLELAEGTVGELCKGSCVTYTVHETILKTFQLSMSASDDEDNPGKENIKAEQEFASGNYAILATSVALLPEQLEEGVSWVNRDPAPAISSAVLSSMEGGLLSRGLWRCTAGSCTYVEQDELFTVLEGRATVTIKRSASPEKKLITSSDTTTTPSVTVRVTEGAGKEERTSDRGEERESGRTLQLSKGMIGEFKRGDVATFVVDGEEAFLKSFQITGTTA